MCVCVCVCVCVSVFHLLFNYIVLYYSHTFFLADDAQLLAKRSKLINLMSFKSVSLALIFLLRLHCGAIVNVIKGIYYI